MLELTHIIKQHANLPALEVVLNDEHGDPVDLTGASVVTFRMHLIGDATTSVSGACDVVEATEGLVSYEFTSANTQISGTYLGQISATFADGTVQTFPYNNYYLILIQSDLVDDVSDIEPELTFATVADARSMGYEVTADQLLRAQGHIEVVCGRMIEEIANTQLSVGDAAILKKATVYQAKWLAANPDVEERTDVTQIRTAGLSGESAVLTTDGIVLAPLARRLLTRLSWVRSRSIKTRLNSRGTGVNPNSLNGDVIPWNNM